jgi:endonuclease/exonuclease/phosphatase family metal-dependent hydrolase
MGVSVRVLSWNLYHGRDFPPDPVLGTWRSRLLRTAERNDSHAQVNRPLLDEFCAWIAARDWDVALLQEAPPHWLGPLAERAGAAGAMALTSRNQLAPLRRRLARWNPDLLASNEGGSNQLLVRGRVHEVRRLTLARLPERRRMLWARVESGGLTLCVANLHASAGRPAAAEREVLHAAERAVDWAGDAPLVFGGDFNLRPARAPSAFERLRDLLGTPPTGPQAIDHVLARGLEQAEPPRALAPEERELRGPDGLRIRLSDHAPVVASFVVR